MEARTFALDPAMGMLIECDNYCGEEHGARMKMVEEPTDTLKAKFVCTHCGEERYMTYKAWTPFLSFKIEK